MGAQQKITKDGISLAPFGGETSSVMQISSYLSSEHETDTITPNPQGWSSVIKEK